MRTSGDWLCGVLCVLPIVAGALIAAVIYWARRRLSMRGLQSRIEMDGASCLKTDTGDVVIQRRTGRNVFYLVFLTAIQVGMVTLTFMAVRDSMVADWEDLAGGVVVIGVAQYLLARSLRLSSLRFSVESGEIEFRRGFSRHHQVPFRAISRVTVADVARHVPLLPTEVWRIEITLDDGDSLQLGTVSGKAAQQRAGAIAQLVTEATGAMTNQQPPGAQEHLAE